MLGMTQASHRLAVPGAGYNMSLSIGAFLRETLLVELRTLVLVYRYLLFLATTGLRVEMSYI